MATLRLALAQHDFPVGAIAANAARMRELAARARAQGAQLVAFPELALCGYPPEDLLLRPSFLAAGTHALQRLAAELPIGLAALIGHAESADAVFNAASLLRGGHVEQTYRKQQLPNYAVFDEKRYFHAGHGSVVVDVDGVRIGVLICEDIWHAAPAAAARVAGAELLLVINASPYDRAHAAQRELALALRARANALPIAYVNLVGGQDDLLFDGGALLVQADGSIAARAPAFVDALLLVEYDNAVRRLRALDWPLPQGDAIAVLYAGLVRGIRDYVRKNGFHDVLLGLSGGIDSALTLALAVDALGAEHVRGYRLPSRYTSDLSGREADAQARKLGVRCAELPIEPGFEALLHTLAPEFAGSAPDLTEENLQSRIRGVLLMALSNKFGALLLSTGNKSELAVGYATLYGDMCGAYAPLKDVYKTTVYALARWRNQKESGTLDSAAGEVIPHAVIARAPSAELRAGQTDQDSLPPYDLLDAILERFVEGEQSQAEIVAAGFDAETVRRVARMVLVNEFKRRQAAPGPKVTTRAFGRERRYPITSGWRP
ncbi:MAG: NAD+ synthase [Metallibacterium scheffleri]|uniref:NAD+ synthase n=1 Tax=Metallibacterium scheffleri TaxID=993689 RepID=UPI0026E95BAF|nr:NAD+ synthase [Metallibacterium scheffleri]MCK9366294.1 NAD+ synthase [Metallibacterium scheffleri]